jgi:hypothetical protein
VDTWLMEDMLKPRKERRTAASIHRQLVKEHGFRRRTVGRNEKRTPVKKKTAFF